MKTVPFGGLDELRTKKKENDLIGERVVEMQVAALEIETSFHSRGKKVGSDLMADFRSKLRRFLTIPKRRD